MENTRRKRLVEASPEIAKLTSIHVEEWYSLTEEIREEYRKKYRPLFDKIHKEFMREHNISLIRGNYSKRRS